jgi:hypothetical protein
MQKKSYQRPVMNKLGSAAELTQTGCYYDWMKKKYVCPPPKNFGDCLS